MISFIIDTHSLYSCTSSLSLSLKHSLDGWEDDGHDTRDPTASPSWKGDGGWEKDPTASPSWKGDGGWEKDPTASPSWKGDGGWDKGRF